MIRSLPSLVLLAGSQLAFAFNASAASATAPPARPVEVSGIYPHLAYFNTSGECGTGAVVPWADRLWIVTYAPHKPKGSDDQLYAIDSALRITARPESVGGTPANRFIHRESQQLFIGLHAIDAQGRVRTIPYEKMYGRPGKTIANNMDLLDVWKTHICREANHLFLLVPKIRVSKDQREAKIYPVVKNRLETFFDANVSAIDVDSIHLFGY
jgi:hypothetical protein